MATNYIKGNVETTLYTPGAAVSAGSVVKIVVANGKRTLLGVALSDIPANQPGAVAITGCFLLPKATGVAILQMEDVCWKHATLNVSNNAATQASGDVMSCGAADQAAASGATTVPVWLNMFGGTYTA